MIINKINIMAIGVIISFILQPIIKSFPAEIPFSKKPNVILFSIDTLRADHLSCYGNNNLTSPRIDLFAEDCVLFRNALSQAPMTASSHMSIFTALSPPVHGITNIDDDGNYHALNKSVLTLAQALNRAGYITIGLHGGGQLDGKLGFQQGFDEYTDEFQKWENYRGPAKASLEDFQIIRKSITKYLRLSKGKGKPIFLFLHHYLCHDPYVKGPKEFRMQFLGAEASNFPSGIQDVIWDKGIASCRDSFWKNVDLKNPEHKQHIISLYDGGVFYSDHIFNEVLNILKKEKCYTNSIIILLSDHGEEFYEHGDKLHWRLFVESLHVPLLIKFPGQIFRGTIIEKPVRLMDIMPTLLDFLNIRIDHPIQGVSFLSLITNGVEYNPLISSYSDGGDYIRIVKNGYVYSNQPSAGYKEWLFSEERNPKKQHNLIKRKPEILQQMRAEAARIMDKDHAFLKTIKKVHQKFLKADKSLREQLKALGYIN